MTFWPVSCRRLLLLLPLQLMEICVLLLWGDQIG